MICSEVKLIPQEMTNLRWEIWAVLVFNEWIRAILLLKVSEINDFEYLAII